MSNYGRHDYRDPAREKFGKPGISYPDGSLLHPTLIESFAHRKDSTTGTLSYLTLSSNPRAQGCYLTKQILPKGDDDSQNITATFERLPGVVKTSYPVDETYDIGTKVQTQIVIAQDNPPWAGRRFSGEFALNAMPVDGETVTVGGTTYTFKTALTASPSPVANEILIAATIAGTLFNLSSAINLDWGIGVNFGTGTVQNPNATSWFSLNTMIVADINNPSATFATTTTCVSGGWPAATATTALFIEIKNIDTNRMFRIASRVTLPLPPDLTYWIGREISLPDTLQSLTPQWNESRSFGDSVQSGACAAIGAGERVAPGGWGLAVQILNGFRGSAKGQLIRHFSLTPPAEGDIAAPTIIKPALGTATVKTSGENVSKMDGAFSAGCSIGNTVGVKTQHIGPLLTGGVGIVSVGATGTRVLGGIILCVFRNPHSLRHTIGRDTVTVGSQVYTFKTSLGSTAGQVLIGGSAASALVNLMAAINKAGGSGYVASTAKNTFASAIGTAAIGVVDDGDGNFTPPDVTAFAISPDGESLYPAVEVAASASASMTLNIPASIPTQINSGDTIVETVSVQQWRRGFISSRQSRF